MGYHCAVVLVRSSTSVLWQQGQQSASPGAISRTMLIRSLAFGWISSAQAVLLTTLKLDDYDNETQA